MVARRLTLLRHGQAVPIDSGPEDFERTLTRRGANEAQKMAARILRRGMIPDLILVSPAERAWATATAVAQACELDPRQVQCARELYLATGEMLWHLLALSPPTAHHILLCGHNPGLSQLAGRLGPVPQSRELATAGLATAVWQDGTWATLQPETASSCHLDDPERLDLLDPG